MVIKSPGILPQKKQNANKWEGGTHQTKVGALHEAVLGSLLCALECHQLHPMHQQALHDLQRALPIKQPQAHGKVHALAEGTLLPHPISNQVRRKKVRARVQQQAGPRVGLHGNLGVLQKGLPASGLPAAERLPIPSKRQVEVLCYLVRAALREAPLPLRHAAIRGGHGPRQGVQHPPAPLQRVQQRVRHGGAAIVPNALVQLQQQVRMVQGEKIVLL
jgi:hypothetical protein